VAMRVLKTGTHRALIEEREDGATSINAYTSLGLDVKM